MLAQFEPLLIQQLFKQQPISGQPVGFYVSEICSKTHVCVIKEICYDFTASHNGKYE